MAVEGFASPRVAAPELFEQMSHRQLVLASEKVFVGDLIVNGRDRNSGKQRQLGQAGECSSQTRVARTDALATGPGPTSVTQTSPCGVKMPAAEFFVADDATACIEQWVYQLAATARGE